MKETDKLIDYIVKRELPLAEARHLVKRRDMKLYLAYNRDIRKKMLNAVSPKEKKVLKEAMDGTSLAEIGRRMDLSRERVRQIVNYGTGKAFFIPLMDVRVLENTRVDNTEIRKMLSECNLYKLAEKINVPYTTLWNIKEGGYGKDKTPTSANGIMAYMIYDALGKKTFAVPSAALK